MCAHAEGALRDFDGGILTDDQYFRARTELSNSLSDFHAIQFGESQIENDQIWLKLFGSLDGFQSVRTAEL
jgi:hypothetical protein